MDMWWNWKIIVGRPDVRGEKGPRDLEFLNLTDLYFEQTDVYWQS
jgi:hypothetical protein